MLRKCTKKDEKAILEYLQEDYCYNLLMIADVVNYGFDSRAQRIYCHEAEGKMAAVYLCFYKTLHIYSQANHVNREDVVSLVEEYSPDYIVGKEALVNELRRGLVGFEHYQEEIYLLQNDKRLKEGCEGVEMVNEKVLGEIAEFMKGVDKEKKFYTSKRVMKERYEYGFTKHYVFRCDGQIVAHGNVAASTDRIVLIDNVAAKSGFRDLEYGEKIISCMAREAMAKGQEVCCFLDQKADKKRYQELGFHYYGTWDRLVARRRPQERATYISIYNWLREDIVSGIYQTDSLMPSENVLSEKYNVSRNTLRQALTLLNTEGYIRKQQGKGSIVTYNAKKKTRFYNYLKDDALEEVVKVEYELGEDVSSWCPRKSYIGEVDGEILCSRISYYGKEELLGMSFLQIPVQILRIYGVDLESPQEIRDFISKGIYYLGAGAELVIEPFEASEQISERFGVQAGTSLLNIDQKLYDGCHRLLGIIRYYFRGGKYRIHYER
ncbi:DNA-binding GntR family transcriptional regulator/predicted GNAT family acetyltransferase [Lachnospiraceae bacterium PM6-15]|uniref:GntR family transcriptional regulator n=1 Tax=Ohessyouella blattaphilus TaxID=2949333 RepID=UPI003E30E8AA